MQLFQNLPGNAVKCRAGAPPQVSVRARIARRLVGELSLESAPAGGTLVALTLPGPAAAPTARASQAPDQARDIG